MGFFGNKPPVFDWAKDEPDWHYEVCLTYTQREALVRLIAHEQPRVTIAERNYLLALLKNAKRHAGQPLPDATLDWAELEAEAERQGCSPADVLWDRARHTSPPDIAA